MDVLWSSVGVLLTLAGIAGCLLPFLPGPPLCFVGLLLQQLRADPPFTANFLWIWAGVTVAVTVLDYVVPVYGTRKFGGTRYGVWGCTAGLLVGLFFGPWGIILGPFAGAFLGELMANNGSEKAFIAAVGSFAGFLFGTLLKLVACLVMTWYLVASFF